MSEHFYTDEKNAQIVIALLKAHGIRKIVVNPGTANIPIARSVQKDPWFEVYSGIDERHSAYMAIGMAAESGEPVVLSCTGATASRNYMPALTEAFYRKLPVLALTSSHHFNSAGNLLPQMIDRTVLPRDMVKCSVQCPVPANEQQAADCQLNVNKALLELFRHGGGPVHINLETERTFTFNARTLPEVRIVRRYCGDRSEWPDLPASGKIAVWIGNHKPIRGALLHALEKFAVARNAAVFVDKTSSYSGACAVEAAIIGQQTGAWKNPRFSNLRPDTVIHIGEVSGDYESFGMFAAAKEFWRVSEDGEARDLLGRLTAVFETAECEFFSHYAGAASGDASYPSALAACVDELRRGIPELPFSNIWMASRLAPNLPHGSCLHLGILNSLRSWNMFKLPPGVSANCNTGGFGIDGCLSTMIGASLASPQRLFFGVFGDLSFFYDWNSIGNRHIGNNVRILLVNNGCGGEFNLYTHPASLFGAETNGFIAAGGHFRQKSSALVRGCAEELGFKYLSARGKDEFQTASAEFLKEDRDRPVIFECFTSPQDESKALHAMKNISPYVPPRSVSSAIGSVLPQPLKNIVKTAIGR